MSQQTEALRLADELDLYAAGDKHQRAIEESAAELRRLSAINAQLLEALEDLLADTQHDDHICEDLKWCPVVKARAAIAAAKGEA